MQRNVKKLLEMQNEAHTNNSMSELYFLVIKVYFYSRNYQQNVIIV